jgi:hypothetical protein
MWTGSLNWGQVSDHIVMGNVDADWFQAQAETLRSILTQAIYQCRKSSEPVGSGESQGHFVLTV